MKIFWRLFNREKFVLVFLSLLAMLRALHEISKFRIDMTWIPLWGYPFGVQSPPFDSYHVYGGLFVLVFLSGLRLRLLKKCDHIKCICIPLWGTGIIITFEFIFYFWIFNLFYHVIFMTSEFIQWEYVIPFIK